MCYYCTQTKLALEFEQAPKFKRNFNAALFVFGQHYNFQRLNGF